jgi:pyridoxamine 5'-phosphate oxidase
MFGKKELSLNDIFDEIWTMLERGAARFNDPLHAPVLGTATETGCSLRMVILRDVDKSSRTLVCHTDGRAAKKAEIGLSPAVSWLFYHPKHQIQVRMTGPAKLHSQDVFADQQWEKTGLTSRINYLAQLPPGTPVAEPTSGLPDFLRNKVPALARSQKGRKNFMAIACRIDTIDWLILKKLGNLRARFTWQGESWQSSWLVP